MYSKIYLIDDDELINLVHDVLLRKLGLNDKAIFFENPEEALHHLRFKENNEEPILLLLDIKMPELTGFEFLETMVLDNFPDTIDVAIVTSSIFEEDKSLAITFPQFVKGFVSKPLQAADLMNLLQLPIPVYC